jgi:radical SAM-linked protein
VPPEEKRRLRLRFSKEGKIRFTSHRDVARMWERALRRSGLQVAYSQGFVPQPTGCESDGEYLDVRLGAAPPAETPVAELPAVLSAVLPDGIEVQVAAFVPDTEGSLQQEVASCTWELEVLSVPSEELAERVEKLLAAPILTVRRERKGRPTEDDVRPAILTLSTTGSQGHLQAELATRPLGVRPGDLVTALSTDAVLERARRTHQWIERDGARFEPLPWSRPGTGDGAQQNARRDPPHVRDRNQREPGGWQPSAGTTLGEPTSRGR